MSKDTKPEKTTGEHTRLIRAAIALDDAAKDYLENSPKGRIVDTTNRLAKWGLALKDVEDAFLDQQTKFNHARYDHIQAISKISKGKKT